MVRPKYNAEEGLFGSAEVAAGQVHGEDEGRHNRVEAL